MIIVFNLLKKRTALATWKRLCQWFEENPRRKVCNTDLGKIHRAHMKDDFLKFCVPGVKLS